VSTNRSPIEERLLNQSHPPGSALDIAATHLRSAANQRPPGPPALARVRARLSASRAWSHPRRLRWKTALALVAISAGIGGATGATIWVALPILKRARPTPAAVVPAHLEPRSRPRRGRLRSPAAPAEDTAQVSPMALPGAEPIVEPVFPIIGPEPAPAPAPVSGATSTLPAVPAPARPARRVAMLEPRRLPAGASPTGTQPTAAIAQDARLLATALRSLRHDHDPRAALAALDVHARRFPDSALRPEADITRVDALLALDRRQSALAVLDGLAIPATTRGRELTIVRGELRVGAKRYAEAVTDFTRTLADGVWDTLSERALHGRIACYLATGNQVGARADLRDYLSRFPAGRFAPGIRRTLGDIDGR
jgi:hypothetical protein